MHRRSATQRALTWWFLLLGFAFSVPGPVSLIPSVEAASASASKPQPSPRDRQHQFPRGKSLKGLAFGVSCGEASPVCGRCRAVAVFCLLLSH